MSNRIFGKWRLALVLAAAPFVGGCNQQAANVFEAQAAAAVEQVPPVDPGVVETPPVAESAESETRPVPAEPEKPLPSNIQASPALAEVIKLANAGVDESVMLTFVTNSTRIFNIGSEEIIYLNDIGVPSEVVTAMIQRDQALKSEPNTALAAATAPAPANQVTAPLTPPVSVEQTADSLYATEAYAPPPQQVNVSYFYDTLSPYGSWVDVEGYGRCWQPTVVVANPGWRPYGDRGHWVYSDCGWYWASDYSWGWAPFHYGRWFPHARWGWCWAPDTVWGPSWVNWRYTDGYCGWAPLPPAARYRPGFGFSYHNRSVGVSFDFGLASDCYTFVPTHRFCDSRPYRHFVPRHEVTKIYNKTVVVNKIVGNNNTIINQGIAPERISAVTRTPIRKVSLRDAGVGTRSTHREHFDPNSRTLAVYRPRVSPDTDRSARSLTEPSRMDRSGDNRAQPNTRLQTQPGTATATSPTTRTHQPFSTRREALPPERRPVVTPGSPAQRDPRTQSSESRVVTPNIRTPERSETRPTPAPADRSRAEKSGPQVTTGAERPVQTAPVPKTVPARKENVPNRKENVPPNSLIVIGKKDAAQREAFNQYSSPPAVAAPTEPRKAEPIFHGDRTREPSVPAQNNASRSIFNQNRQIVPPTPQTPGPVVTAPARVPDRLRMDRQESRVFQQEAPRPSARVENQFNRSPAPAQAPPAARQFSEPAFRPPAHTVPERPQISPAPRPQAPPPQASSAPRSESRQAPAASAPSSGSRGNSSRNDSPRNDSGGKRNP